MQPAFVSTLARSLPLQTTRLAKRCATRTRTLPVLARPRAARWTSSATTPAVDKARAAISTEKIVVFSTTYCPYCAHVKSLLESFDAPMAVFETDTMGQDGDAIRSFLMSSTGQRTVPNVFIGGKHIGGCDDTIALHNDGLLADMIKQA